MRAPGRALRVAVLGGSVSRARRGYVAAAISMLREEHGVDVELAFNGALGAGSSCVGLIQLHDGGAPGDWDVLLLEYGMNDAGSYQGDQRRLRRTSDCFEGVVRRALQDNPDLLVCTILFSGRSSYDGFDAAPVMRRMRKVSDHYGAHVIDVDGALGAAMAGDDTLWDDDLHPSVPKGTFLIGRHVAAGVAEALARHAPRPLPVPMARGELSDTTGYVSDVAELAVRGSPPARRYTNSAFDVTARCLEPGDELAFRLQGELLAVYYVADRTSGVLQVEREGRTWTMPTMPRAFETADRWPFLVSYLDPLLHFGSRIRARREQVVRLQVAESAPDLKEPVPYAPPAKPEGSVLSVAGLLYRGTLEPLAAS